MTPLPPAVLMQPSNGGLAVARALVRAGVPVHVLASESDAHTAQTRRARARVMPDYAEAPDEWLRELEACAGPDGVAVVLAGADEASEFLSRQRDRISADLRFFERQDDVHLPLMGKTATAELAHAAGVRVPWTKPVRSAVELEAVVASATYPCVLKPVLSHLWRPLFGHDRVLLAYSAEELRAHAEPALAASLETIVSEYIPGPDDHVEEAILVRAPGGDYPMQFGCRKLRQSPRGFGAASLCESAPLEESLALARQLLDHARYVGIAGVETKRHADTGEVYLIEVNVRIPTQYGLGDACGVDASWRLYATLARLPLAPQPPQVDGVRLLFPELEAQELRRFLAGERGEDRPPTKLAWLRSWARTRDVGVLDPRDPGPGLELARRSIDRRRAS